MTLGLIWAQAAGGVIGGHGHMPWNLTEDLTHFREVTLGHTIIMGRGTWDSLPPWYRPLPGRRNIVLTRQPGWRDIGAEVAHNLTAALAGTSSTCKDRVWVIGGGQILREAIRLADRLEVTEIRERYDGDTFAPAVGQRWRLASSTPEEGWRVSKNGLNFRFRSYVPALSPQGINQEPKGVS